MPAFTDPDVLEQFVKASGLKYSQTGASWVFQCPRCRSDKKLYVSKSTGRFVCWKCKETDNYQGRPEFAFRDLLGWTLKEISSRLYGGTDVRAEVYLDVCLRDFFGDDDVEVEHEVLQPVDYPCDYYPIQEPHAERGRQYLEGRGIPADIAELYGIHYAPVLRRVVFPVESRGVLYGWQGRLVIPDQHLMPDGSIRQLNKIESSTGIPRDRTLMFSDRLVGYDHAILTEGPIDAIKCHRLGGNVCAMGKAVTPQQMQLLIYSGVKRIYLGLDPDAAEETQRLVKDYFGDVELLRLEAKGGKKPDLGAMEFDEVEELFRGARPIGAGALFVYMKPPSDFVSFL